MSGVWKFHRNGVMSLLANPLAESSIPGPCYGHKVLVHRASNETMRSLEQLHVKLVELGWRRLYSRTPHSRHYYHRSSCHISDLITLPELPFACIRTTHMYDIVVKTHSAFQVRDADTSQTGI